jgi:RNA polymerase sigma factor (sigma-70 family)
VTARWPKQLAQPATQVDGPRAGAAAARAAAATQMTWLRLAENAHRVRFPERLGGWLATTARRKCLHILRQRELGPIFKDVAPEPACPSTDPEQRAINAHTRQTLRKLIDELPPLRRTMIRMLFTDNPCSYNEIARIAGIPLGWDRTHSEAGLRQLRDKLDAAPPLAPSRRTALTIPLPTRGTLRPGL